MNHFMQGRVGTDHFPLPPKSLLHGHNSTSDLLVWGDLVDAQVLKDHSEGDQLNCVNLKGILGEAPIHDILSSNESTSSLRS